MKSNPCPFLFCCLEIKPTLVYFYHPLLKNIPYTAVSKQQNNCAIKMSKSKKKNNQKTKLASGKSIFGDSRKGRILNGVSMLPRRLQSRVMKGRLWLLPSMLTRGPFEWFKKPAAAVLLYSAPWHLQVYGCLTSSWHSFCFFEFRDPM